MIFDNIRKFLRYLLYSNMGEVLTVFLGIVFAGVLGLTAASDGGLVLPLLATQILWINLVTDSGPALAMGVDPEIDDVMVRPPRGLHDRAIDTGMWIGIAVTGLVISVVTLLTMDIFLPGGLIPGGTDTLEVARTAGFTTLVFAALITAFNARSASSSAFRGLFSNRVAVGCRRPRRRAADRRRIAAAAAGRVRHRDARRPALARLRGNGVVRALGRGDPQVRHPGRRTATGANGGCLRFGPSTVRGARTLLRGTSASCS